MVQTGRSPGRGTARRAGAAAAASVVALGAAATLLAPGTGSASSHREAPLIAGDPAADGTDLYAFVSPDKPDTVTFVANWWPFEEPAGGPNFYPWDPQARYSVKIDNDGDAKPDLTYRWTFESKEMRQDTFLYNNGQVTSLVDRNLKFEQTYRLVQVDERGKETVLVRNGKVAPSRVGDASMPRYQYLRDRAVSGVAGGGMAFAGQADDPFFLDLRVFDLLYGGDLSETGSDTLTGFNVNTVALQLPIKRVTSKGDPVIGVWSTTERRATRVTKADGTQQHSGAWVQVSRLGNPLVNEVVFPATLKDAFNALAPEKDASVEAAVDRVLDPELPKLIEGIYGIEAPEAPRDDLVSVFLTGIEGLNKPKAKDQRPAELLRLNTAVPPADEPSRLGVLGGDLAGFPNGRRLSDDVVDIAIQAVEGAVRTGKIVEPLAAGDRVDTNDKRFEATFPYVALPHSGSDPRPGTVDEGQSAEAGLVPAAPAAAAPGAPGAASVASGSSSSAAPAAWTWAAGTGGTALVAGGAVLVLRSRRTLRAAPAR